MAETITVATPDDIAAAADRVVKRIGELDGKMEELRAHVDKKLDTMDETLKERLTAHDAKLNEILAAIKSIPK